MFERCAYRDEIDFINHSFCLETKKTKLSNESKCVDRVTLDLCWWIFLFFFYTNGILNQRIGFHCEIWSNWWFHHVDDRWQNERRRFDFLLTAFYWYDEEQKKRKEIWEGQRKCQISLWYFLLRFRFDNWDRSTSDYSFMWNRKKVVADVSHWTWSLTIQ